MESHEKGLTEALEAVNRLANELNRKRIFMDGYDSIQQLAKHYEKPLKPSKPWWRSKKRVV